MEGSQIHPKSLNVEELTLAYRFASTHKDVSTLCYHKMMKLAPGKQYLMVSPARAPKALLSGGTARKRAVDEDTESEEKEVYVKKQITQAIKTKKPSASTSTATRPAKQPTTRPQVEKKTVEEDKNTLRFINMKYKFRQKT